MSRDCPLYVVDRLTPRDRLESRMASPDRDPFESLRRAVAKDAREAFDAVNDAVRRAARGSGPDAFEAYRRRVARDAREVAGRGYRASRANWRHDVAGAIRRAGDEAGRVLEGVREGLRRELDAYNAGPYAFLFDNMLAGPGLHLHLSTRVEGPEPLLAALEGAFDETVLETALAAVDGAPYLGAAQRERLRQGLRSLREPGVHWTEPSDRLLLGLDGALWQAALHTGVIDDNDHLLHDPRRKRARSKDLVEARFGLSISGTYRRFLRDGVFDPQGQRARHGRDEPEHRAYALLAGVGVLGGSLTTPTARHLRPWPPHSTLW